VSAKRVINTRHWNDDEVKNSQFEQTNAPNIDANNPIKPHSQHRKQRSHSTVERANLCNTSKADLLRSTWQNQSSQIEIRRMCELSVVMPVFNGKVEYLEQAFRSVVAQTFVDFEFLIVDDGSTDADVRQHLDRLVATHPNSRSAVRLIRFAENRGIVAALNEGIRQSTGSVSLFVGRSYLSYTNVCLW
jgi:hypothetical protein